MKKVFIVAGSYAYQEMFKSLGFELTSTLEDANLVCFTGGEDVTPGLYGAHKHPATYNDLRRDMQERLVFEEAFDNKIPMVGICRGAQFLNVMSGGEMYQHVGAHTRPHYIVDQITGETVYVSSTHHQMMKPSAGAELVASANQNGSREWFEGTVYKRDVSDIDYEVVYYGNTKCLCFQPHPEFNDAEYEGMRTYFASLLTRYLGM